MSTRRNEFTNACEYDAIYPWHHATDAFCTCTRCHEVRKHKILNKCAVLSAGLEMLVWPSGQSAADMPPSNISHLPLDPTVIARRTQWAS